MEKNKHERNQGNTVLIEFVKQIFHKYGLFILIFLFWLAVSCCVPVGGDDWEVSNWHSESGLDHTFLGMIRGWSSFNGRVMNNVWDSVLSHYRIVWNFFSAFIYTITLWFVSKIFAFRENKLALLCTFLMMLCVSEQFRAETQFHVVANISYTICHCCIWWFLYAADKSIQQKEIRIFDSRMLNIAAYTLIAIFISLWIENLTITFCMAVFLFDIEEWKRKKKLNELLCGSTLGAILGSAFLFSSIGIENRMDSSMTLTETIKAHIFYFLDHLILSQMKVYAFLSFFVLLAVFNNKLLFGKNKYTRGIIIFLNMIVIFTAAIDKAASLCNAETWVNRWILKFSGRLHADIRCVIIFSAIILFAVLVEIVCSGQKMQLFLYLSAFASAAPMILAPGARNMIFVLWVVFSLGGYYISLIHFETKDKKKIFQLLIGILLLVRVDHYAFALKDAVSVQKLRDKIVQEYKISSARASCKEDYFLIWPVFSDAFIGNLNSAYYEQSIINYYDLPGQTQIWYDDGFLVRSVILDIDGHGEGKAELEQIQRYGYHYDYQYRIYFNGTVILEEQRDSSIFEFSAVGNGTYRAECVLTNKDTGETKTVYSEEIVYE